MTRSPPSSSVPHVAPEAGGAAPRQRRCWHAPRSSRRTRRSERARLLRAAAADLTAGNSVRAQANLARALPDLHDPLLLARARQLEATIAFIDSRPWARTGPHEGGWARSPR